MKISQRIHPLQRHSSATIRRRNLLKKKKDFSRVRIFFFLSFFFFCKKRREDINRELIFFFFFFFSESCGSNKETDTIIIATFHLSRSRASRRIRVQLITFILVTCVSVVCSFLRERERQWKKNDKRKGKEKERRKKKGEEIFFFLIRNERENYEKHIIISPIPMRPRNT